MRKKLLSLLILTVMITLLSACRGGGSTTEDPVEGEKIVIKYWNSLTGADGDVMRQLVKQFNDAHKNEIEVVETFVNEVDYYTNLNLLVPMRKGPDVAIMHSYLVQSYADEGLLRPIEPMLESSEIEIKAEDYITDIFNSLYFEDELYAIPLDVHTVGIYYNKTLLEKYDLEVPTNRAELLAAANIVQAGEEDVWGLPISTVWPSEWIFTTSLYQNGGLEINSELNPAYNSPEGKAALEAVADLIHVEKVSPVNLSVDQDLFMFQSGKALFHIQGSWMLRSIIESKIEFGVIPLSNMFGTNTDTKNQISARSHTFVVPNDSTDMHELKEAAVMTFIKYMTENAYVWAQAGQIPASNVARATAEYQALPYLNGFGAIENFRVAAQSPYFHEAYSPIYSRVTQALANSNYNAQTLLTAAENEALQLLAEAR